LKYFVIILIFASSNLWAQDESAIYKADTIYFYGYDFSYAIVKTKHPINDCVFPWIYYTSEDNPPSYFENKMYASVIHDFTYTNSVNKELIESRKVGEANNELFQTTADQKTTRYPVLYDNTSSDSSIKEKDKDVSIMRISNENIKKYLSEYYLKQKNGIGLVCIISEINKVKESTLLQFIFFDIKTRNVYTVIDKNIGGASGVGMENHWKSNFSTGTRFFLEEYNSKLYFDYRKEYKRKKKRRRKVRK